jgi:hypothetical protein
MNQLVRNFIRLRRSVAETQQPPPMPRLERKGIGIGGGVPSAPLAGAVTKSPLDL